ncbi:hypothetical protein [Halarsenatibacter silvermanii]|uniref:Uncharacterized protein n=1 Tax=Halarsenatibacter silvermanii TaxID=321763 RepID=A0A1G9RBL9_9FIRM|nr:hypothetical protein [Halarsenatibacter silvermanii]SDM19775.1 hypothetical protein SAMN04488692_1216 [Halarsenatibacter silvermanii]
MLTIKERVRHNQPEVWEEIERRTGRKWSVLFFEFVEKLLDRPVNFLLKRRR